VGFTHKSLSITLYCINIGLTIAVLTLVHFGFDVTSVFVILLMLSVLILPTFSIKRRILRRLGFDIFKQVNPNILPINEVSTRKYGWDLHPNDDPEKSDIHFEDIIKK
jgi:hypothetical protein